MNVDEGLQQLWSDSISDDDFNRDIDEDNILEDILLNAVTVIEIDIVQCERDRELPVDTQSGWSTIDTPPVVMPFDGDSGLSCEIPDNCIPLDVFNIMFDNEMWQILINQTDLYAENRI